MKNIKRIIINLFLIFFLVILQISFLSNLKHPINNLNLILSAVLFITIILNFRVALGWGLAAGLMFDLYSSVSFGIITIAFLITILFVNLLFDNFFTNRSLYSLIMLGLIGTLVYNALIIGLNFIFNLIKISGNSISLDKFLIFDIFWQIALNLVLISIIFLSFNLVSKKLKSAFIIK